MNKLDDDDNDMRDPFAPRSRPLRPSDHDHMVATFTFRQPFAPEKPITRSQAARDLHPLARDAGVLGTIYEQGTKVWKRNCQYDLQFSLRVAIHGTTSAISNFMGFMMAKLPQYGCLLRRGYQRRPVRELGGKPGDIMKPPRNTRYTKFGRNSAK